MKKRASLESSTLKETEKQGIEQDGKENKSKLS